MANLQIAVYNTGGSLLGGPIRLCVWFNFPCGDTISDPQIIFDTASGLWFSSALDQNVRDVSLDSCQIDGAFFACAIYKFQTANNNCPDQPLMGTDTYVLALSISQYRCGCDTCILGPEYWIVNKQDLVNFGPAHFSAKTPRENFVNNIYPAQHLSSSNVMYMVSVNASGVSDLATVIVVSGVPPSPISTSNYTVQLYFAPNPPPLPLQPGGSNVNNYMDNRVVSAAWYQNNLWFALNDECANSVSCGRFVEVSTLPAHNRLQDIEAGITSDYSFYPALTIDTKGGLGAVMGYSSLAYYPGVVVTGRHFNDPSGSMQQGKVVKTGTGASVDGSWGDYFGAALDPGGKTARVVGEYGTNNHWGTWMTSVTMSYYLTMNYVSQSDGECGTINPSSGWYAEGSLVSISASYGTGCSFLGWTGSGSISYTGTSATHTITMNTNITETGTFFCHSNCVFSPVK
ncbi:MAG: hypothetical protein HY296_03395 [Thaumarchaeota archaeon]|nr:hypothetical protein [Nitrososphaerota archaeon]